MKSLITLLVVFLSAVTAQAEDYGLPRATPESQGFAPDLGNQLRTAMQVRVNEGVIPRSADGGGPPRQGGGGGIRRLGGYREKAAYNA